MKRRAFLASVGTLACSPARAQAWPDRPLRLVVPFPPGGSVDILGRAVAEPLSRRLQQPVVVENRAGAGGSIGAEAVARAAPDGYTVLVASIGILTFNRYIYKRPGTDPARDFTPVAYLWDVGNVLVVPAASPWHSVADLVAAGRAKGELRYGTPGNGTSDHIASALFGLRTGLKVRHIPYRGGPAIVNDLVDSRFDYTVGNIPSYIAAIRGGGLRALAVAQLDRSPTLPDVPTLAEAGVEGDALPSWSGMLGPRDLPDAVRDRLAAEMAGILAEPSMRERMQEFGAVAVGLGPAALTERIEREAVRYDELIRLLGLNDGADAPPP